MCDKRICAKLIDKASHRYCNTCAIIKNLAVNFVSCPETRQNRWGSNNQARKLNTDLRLGAAPNAPYPYMKRGHPDNVKARSTLGDLTRRQHHPHALPARRRSSSRRTRSRRSSRRTRTAPRPMRSPTG